MLATVALVVSLGVLFQSDLRGGSSPEEVATRYVAAVRGGDRVTLFVLSHPSAGLSAEFDTRIAQYRGIAAERVAIRYEPHPVAAYFLTAVISVDGKAFDEVALEHQARRWYIVRLGAIRGGS